MKVLSLCKVRQRPDSERKNLSRIADLEDGSFCDIRRDGDGLGLKTLYFDSYKLHSLSADDIAIISWEPDYLNNINNQIIHGVEDIAWIEVVRRAYPSRKDLMVDIKSGALRLDGIRDILLIYKGMKALFWRKEQQKELPHHFGVYILTNEKIGKIDDTLEYYRDLTLGEPSEKVWLSTPEEIISKIFKDHVRQMNELARNEKRLGTLLSKIIESPDILKEIEKELDCDTAKAEEYYNNALDAIKKKLTKDNYDSTLFQSLIENDSVLYQKMLDEVEGKWKKGEEERFLQIKELDRNIKQKEEQKKSLETKEKKLRQSIDKLQKDEDALAGKIDKRVREAREDITGLLSEYAWLTPPAEVRRGEECPKCISVPPPELCGEAENLAETRESLKKNLRAAGVTPSLVSDLTNYLLAAYSTRTNLLVAGIGGMEIAKALGASVCGCLPATLFPDTNVSLQTICEAVADCPADIIAVPNTFSGQTLEKVLFAAESAPQKMFLYLTPFTESLMAEPQGLYQHMLPLFSDDYVSGAAVDDYVFQDARKVAVDCLAEAKGDVAENHEFYAAMGLELRQCSVIDRLVQQLHVFAGANPERGCFRALWIPLALCLGKVNELDELKDRFFPRQDDLDLWQRHVKEEK